MSNRFRDSRKTRGLTVEVRNDDFGRALRTFSKKVQELGTMPVSYTHLTLPTNREV